MSKTTEIQWCDGTVNPVTGCSGCELWSEERHTCYAGQLHERWKNHPGFSPDFLKPKLFPGRMTEAAKWSDLSGSKREDKPWLDGMPRLVFVSDMGDALSEKDAIDNDNQPIEGGEVPFSYLKTEIVDTARSEDGSRHQWLWLTKRANRMLQFDRWLNEQHGLAIPQNIWVGTSVTGPKTLNRIEHLRKVGGERTLRFLSVEPLWEEVTLTDRLDGIRWVIIGGESSQGVGAKEFKLEWAETLRDECARARVPFFVKQLGSQPTRKGSRLVLPDKHGGDWSHWPRHLRVREMPLISKEWPHHVDATTSAKTPEHQGRLIDKIPSFDTSAVSRDTRPLPQTLVSDVPLMRNVPQQEMTESKTMEKQTIVPLPTLGTATKTPVEKKRLDKPFAIMSDIVPKAVEWLWKGRIALGEITIVDGDPGTNKSSMMMDIAGRVTTGREMPDGSQGVSGGVCLLSGEDSIQKTLPHRLRNAGANMKRVGVFTSSMMIPNDLGVIEETLFRQNAKLLVIDPLMAFLGRDANSDQAVRQGLTPLREVAERTNTAVVLVRHLNKSGGRQSLYRGSGSIGIVGAARSAMMVGIDPEDPNMRVLCHVKNNLGPLAPSLLFEPVGKGEELEGIIWRGECDYKADDLLPSKKGRGKSTEATVFLLERLADGPVEQVKLEAEGAELGISLRTLERAKKTLGIISHREGFGPGSVVTWERPNQEDAHTPPMALAVYGDGN